MVKLGLSGSPLWESQIKELKSERPEDFVFCVDALGDYTLRGLLESFPIEHREMVKKEVFDNLEHYARFSVPSIYSMLRENLGI